MLGDRPSVVRGGKSEHHYSKYRVLAITANGRLPVSIKIFYEYRNGKVSQRQYRGRHQLWSKAREVDRARVKRGEVRAHSTCWQQHVEKNPYPVQVF